MIRGQQRHRQRERRTDDLQTHNRTALYRASSGKKTNRQDLLKKTVAYLGALRGAPAPPPTFNRPNFYDFFGCFTNFFSLKHQNLGNQ